MPSNKSQKVEKIPMHSIIGEAMDVIREMLTLIAERTQCENNNMGNRFAFEKLVHTGEDLKYFGVGKQIKISKLADSLYSTMKDILVFVMSEMAKESSVDYKFQVPKHTSFVGSIVKSVGIDVIAHNQAYRDYLDSLCSSSGKYGFDANQDMFLNIYRDTVFKLEERGYLFEDDPELTAIRDEDKDLAQLPNSVPNPTGIESIEISDEILRPLPQELISDEHPKAELPSDDSESEILEEIEHQKSLSRCRIIFPYLRRLFETRKSAVVTRRRVESINTFCEPDDEIKAVFNEKLNEYLHNSQNQVDASSDVVRYHCMYMALTYLKEHFPKERVDLMEKSVKSDKVVNTKVRKRYLKVPSGKRPHLIEPISADLSLSIPPEPTHPDGLVTLM